MHSIRKPVSGFWFAKVSSNLSPSRGSQFKLGGWLFIVTLTLNTAIKLNWKDKWKKYSEICRCFEKWCLKVSSVCKLISSHRKMMLQNQTPALILLTDSWYTKQSICICSLNIKPDSQTWVRGSRWLRLTFLSADTWKCLPNQSTKEENTFGFSGIWNLSWYLIFHV